VHVARRAARRLDEWSLAAQKSFLVGIQYADERNFGKIKAFAEQIDSNEDVEIRRPQPAQNFHALDCVNVAMQVAHFQSDIAQIIRKILRRSLRKRRHQDPLALFYALTAELNCLVDLVPERLESNFWIEKACRADNLLDDERRPRRVHIKFFQRLIGG